jgi:hypothetical protein
LTTPCRDASELAGDTAPLSCSLLHPPTEERTTQSRHLDGKYPRPNHCCCCCCCCCCRKVGLHTQDQRWLRRLCGTSCESPPSSSSGLQRTAWRRPRPESFFSSESSHQNGGVEGLLILIIIREESRAICRYNPKQQQSIPFWLCRRTLFEIVCGVKIVLWSIRPIESTNTNVIVA